jgi:hypothetical protein
MPDGKPAGDSGRQSQPLNIRAAMKRADRFLRKKGQTRDRTILNSW